jgi:hypothetical protein
VAVELVTRVTQNHDAAVGSVGVCSCQSCRSIAHRLPIDRFAARTFVCVCVPWVTPRTLSGPRDPQPTRMCVCPHRWARGVARWLEVQVLEGRAPDDALGQTIAELADAGEGKGRRADGVKAGGDGRIGGGACLCDGVCHCIETLGACVAVERECLRSRLSTPGVVPTGSPPRLLRLMVLLVGHNGQARRWGQSTRR